MFVVVFLFSFNIWWFIRDRDPEMKNPYIQTSFHYSEIKKNDQQMSAKVAYIQRHLDSSNSIIITSAQQWRPLMYHLPEYQVYNLEGMFTSNNKYSHTIRVGENWNFIETRVAKLQFSIPKNVRMLLFADGEAVSKIDNASSRKIRLRANSSLVLVPVSPGQTIYYNNKHIIITTK